MSSKTSEFTSQKVRTANLIESDRHDLLRSSRRRLVLDILEGETTHVSLADVASEVATREAGLDGEDAETVGRVKITLHHTHLPKMDEFGVLTYDRDSNQIRQ